MAHYEVLIRDARVVDGTGNPYYRADIGLANGRIARIAPGIDPVLSERVIDASGLTACPGFIDTHSHDDAYLMKDPTAGQKIRQGVTTNVVGNCGFTLAPVPQDGGDFLQKISGIMGGGELPEELTGASSFEDYLNLLQTAGPGTNVVPLVGHATLRVCAIGWENRPPKPEELTEMKRLAAESMEAGAFGFSSGLIYVPAIYAETDELLEVAKTVARYHGVYSTHMRSEGDQEMAALEEAIRIGREAGIPVHISHHKIIGKANWGRSTETLASMLAAREKGLQVTCDQYPYSAGSTTLAACLPPSFASGGPDVYAEKLKDPEVRKAVAAEIEDGDDTRWENLIKGAGFEGMVISFTQKHQNYIGKSLKQIAEEEGRNPYDVFFDLVSREKLGIGIVLFMMDETDIVRIMRSPITMIGSDGIPGFGSNRVHPRMTGTFPRVLGRYVREKGVLTFEEAVRKMTSLPAQTFSIRNKGLIKEGFDADLVLVNRETVIDRGTYEDPMQPPEGIPYVFVNGGIAVDQGTVTGRRYGRLLRHTT